MQNSQSQRMIWLLEELNIDYALVSHKRDEDFRAPPALAEVSTEYGKAPFLVTSRADGDGVSGRGIPESFAIATYLIRKYDKQDKFGMRGGDLVRIPDWNNHAIRNCSSFVPKLVTDVRFRFAKTLSSPSISASVAEQVACL